MAKTRDFADVIRRKLARDSDLADAVEQEHFNADIAMQIFEARAEAGLTQMQLAERAGTHQSVIARLESADYDAHSLSMLRRIALAVGKRLRVEFYSPAIHKDKAPKTRKKSQKPKRQ
jgi:transcriptional regulator with XRE-family HTH domain